jgi:tRNA G37 N-methylase Trm5
MTRSPQEPAAFSSVSRILLTACLLCALQLAARAQDTAKGEQAPKKEPDVVYVPTPQPIVEKMLELAGVHEGDVVYDLGCGDGRIVVTAAKKYGVKAVGIDIDPTRVKEARENVERGDVEKLVTIKEEDIFQTNISDASVVTLYLLPELNVRLMPALKKLKPGTRIVSHQFSMKGAKPKQTLEIRDGSGREHTLYLWVVPWEDEE